MTSVVLNEAAAATTTHASSFQHTWNNKYGLQNKFDLILVLLF